MSEQALEIRLTTRVDPTIGAGADHMRVDSVIYRDVLVFACLEAAGLSLTAFAGDRKELIGRMADELDAFPDTKVARRAIRDFRNSYIRGGFLLKDGVRQVPNLRTPFGEDPDVVTFAPAKVDVLEAVAAVERAEAETEADVSEVETALAILEDALLRDWLTPFRLQIADVTRRALLLQARGYYAAGVEGAWPKEIGEIAEKLSSLGKKVSECQPADAQRLAVRDRALADSHCWAVRAPRRHGDVDIALELAEAWLAEAGARDGGRQAAMVAALGDWLEMEPAVAIADLPKQQLRLLAGRHKERFPADSARREIEETDKMREDRLYRGILREALYETVHNAYHLAGIVEWAPRGTDNEYGGCSATDFPALSFRHTERILSAPFCDLLERDAPGVAASWDHAIRNLEYVRFHRPEDLDVVAPALAFMLEHLLRVLVSVHDRPALLTGSADHASMVARQTVLGAGLDLGRLPEERPTADAHHEVRDRVRLVLLPGGVGDRVFDTLIACYDATGKPTPLLLSLRAMADPPSRPALDADR